MTRPIANETVEAVVRAQLSTALGGRRGMLEAAVPTILFTLTFLSSKELELALVVSVAASLVLLIVRLVQHSSVQFVLNSLFGIGIGAFFAWRSAQGGGDENDQALAYFLPGVIYNGAYALGLTLSVLVRWPLVGFMVGSVAGDPTAWHRDHQVVRLTSHLTWLLVLPCVVRVAFQLPFYLAGTNGAMEPQAAVAVLGFSKILMGWPLQLSALAAMVWLLARDHTPVAAVQDQPVEDPRT
ncbi:MAG TPA: DUF3159 domain-containing protein [Nocardioidaceae bacterium]|nr:DUF3159 domain-containing protein [Nocardioidaceae bacterium]